MNATNLNPAVGVDLGTTNTVVAVQTDETGPRLVQIPQPVNTRSRRELRDNLKSAVVFESESSAVVGAFAARRLDAIVSIKSRMGTRWAAKHPTNSSITLTPAYVSAHILRAAFDAIKEQFPGWDQTAVVTVPASFNTEQRTDTLVAADLAGFKDVRLLDEPTAAFYSFFEQNRASIQAHHDQTVLVFDFGGGTLDVSVIRVSVSKGRVQLDAIGRSRYNNLGGDDVDFDLASFFLAVWQERTKRSLSRVERHHYYQFFVSRASSFKEEVEAYIRDGIPLNEFVVEDTVNVGGKMEQVSFRTRLTQAQYEEIAGIYCRQNSDLNIFRPIGQAFEIASDIHPGFGKKDVSLVLYTGGASRMRTVKAALEAHLAPAPCFAISDEDACNTVALGAASCRYDELHRKNDVQMTTRLLESIMVRREDRHGYIPIVPLTCQPSSEFQAVGHRFSLSQQLITLRLDLFRGSGPNDHNLSPMGRLKLNLPRVMAEGTPYALSYRMTENKTIQVCAEFAPVAHERFSLSGEFGIRSNPDVNQKANPTMAGVNG